MLAGLAPARRRLVLAVLGLVAVGAVLITVLLARASSPAADGPVAQDRPGPVLLVPGYGGGTGSLQSLADRLSAAGRDVTVVPLPGGATDDLGDSAEALDEAGGDAQQRNGQPTRHVVG